MNYTPLAGMRATGSAAGKGGESHIRISFGGEAEELREGLKRIKNYLNNTAVDT